MKITHHHWVPAIDGLRAIAALFVLIHHSNNIQHYALGNVGVALFYSLSGFLAYYVLYRDEQYLGRINYRYFLSRRILRIWPAYFVVIAVASLLATHDARVNAIFTPLFTFTLNWKMAAFTGWPLPCIALLWSISVEQQFYLLAPFVYQLLRSRYAFIFCFLIFLLSNITCIIYIKLHPEQIGNGGLYYATYPYAGIFLIGALVAHWFLKGGQISEKVQWFTFIISVILLVVILRIWAPITFPPYTSYATVPYLLLSIALLLLLISLMPMKKPTLFAQLLSIKPLRALAKISYSLYLVHLLIADYVHIYFLYYLACLTAAILLHILVEKPFLKLKASMRRSSPYLSDTRSEILS